jgi:TonB family protein
MANSNPTPHASTTSDPVAQTLALLQPWIDYVPQKQRRLGLFFVLALMVHLAAFFFIRIDTTRAELQHQTRIHVTVEYPHAVAVSGEPGDDFWDRLTDPRLFLLPLKPMANVASDETPLDLNSNLASHELPQPAPPEDYRATPAAVTPLDQQVGEAMRPPRQPFFYDETPPAIATKTTWQWDESLAARQPTGVPDLPSPISDTDLSPTVLSVAVNSSGAVEHVLVEQSSGDLGASIGKDLNQQAVLAARKIRFQPTERSGLLWGKITVFWRYSAKPREEVVPTPPTTGQ